jgi:hypothetical protein
MPTNIKEYVTKASIEDHISIDDKFYMIELSKGVPTYDSIRDTSYEPADEAVNDLVYNAPKEVLEKLATISKFILIDNSSTDVFYLYSYEYNSLIKLSKSTSILYETFQKEKLSMTEDPLVLHFGLVIPEYAISDGKEKPSLKSYFKNDTIDFYDIENETFGLKEISNILMDINNGRYKRGKVFFFLRYIKNLFKK